MRIVNSTGMAQDTKFISSDNIDLSEQLRATKVDIEISANGVVKASVLSIANGIDIKVDDLDIVMDIYKVVDTMAKDDKRKLFERLRAELI